MPLSFSYLRSRRFYGIFNTETDKANGTDDMFAVGEWVGGASALDQWCSDVIEPEHLIFLLEMRLLVLFRGMEV